MRRVSLFALLLAAAPLHAEPSAPGAMEAPEPPPLPENVEMSAEELGPQVTIRDEGDKHITEYKVNGRVYMIKVQPASGPAYYLTDTDGDGRLETKQEELDPGFLVPKWILFSW